MAFKDPARQREYTRNYLRHYRATHPEYREYMRDYLRKWRAANPDYWDQWYAGDREAYLARKRRRYWEKRA